MQTYFRHQALADTHAYTRCDQRFRIAEDAEGIAAAYTHARPTDGVVQGIHLPTGHAFRYLLMLGIAARHRHQGGKFADEVVLDALYDVLAREPDHEAIAVMARIDHRNVSSQRLFSRHGFEEVFAGTLTAPLGGWLLIIER
ncbi:GNAT family N-acetyltransferase [Streptomyces sp. NPDC048641]|uniref:GNAT family N-acetyltransferase n=1 Tax=Streptomyces sp. NPDC048641 TaxID=3154825 RepID=UPI003442123A